MPSRLHFFNLEEKNLNFGVEKLRFVGIYFYHLSSRVEFYYRLRSFQHHRHYYTIYTIFAPLILNCARNLRFTEAQLMIKWLFG